MTNKVEVGIEAKVTANTRDLEQKVTQATRDLSKKTGDLGTAGMSPARSKDTLKAERDALANLLRASRQAAQQGKADLVKIFGDGLSRAQVDALHSASSRLAGRDSLYRQIGGIGGIASGSSRGFFRTGAEHDIATRDRLQRIGRYAGISMPGAPGAPGGGGAGWGRLAGMAGGAMAGAVTGGGFGAASMLGGAAGLIPVIGPLLGPLVGGVAGAIEKHMDAAKEEAIGTSQFRHSLGDGAEDFEKLRDKVRLAADGMGVAYNESLKLARQFAHTANIRNTEGLDRELKQSYGFSRSLGLDPSQGVDFFAQMRRTGVTDDEKSSRRLALSVADAIGKGGIFAKSDELMASMSNFAQQATRMTLAAPDVGAFASMIAAGTQKNIPGLDVQGTAGIISAADTSMRHGGSFGEASKIAIMGALSNGAPDSMDVFDVERLMEGGLFATTGSRFGHKSMGYRSAQERGDTDMMRHYDELASGKDANVTNLAKVLGYIQSNSGGGHSGYLAAIKNGLGLGSVDQAEGLDLIHRQGGGINGLHARLTGVGVDSDKLDVGQMGTLGDIAYTKDGSRLARYEDRLRKGDGTRKASDEEIKALDAARTPDEKRDVLLKQWAERPAQDTLGDQTLRVQTDMQNALQRIAAEMIPATNTMKDGVLALVEKLAPESDMAKGMRHERDLVAEYDAAQKDADEWHNAPKTRRGWFGETMSTGAAEGEAEAQDRMAAARRMLARTGQSTSRAKQLAYEEDIPAPPMPKSAAAGPSMAADASSGSTGDRLASVVQSMESGGRRYGSDGGLLESVKGAKGEMQVLDSTNRAPGFGVTPARDGSAEERARVGRDYIAAMKKRYGRDDLALAAYNAGPGALDDARGEWGDDYLSHMGKETRNYVKNGMHMLSDEQVQAPQETRQQAAAQQARQQLDINMTLYDQAGNLRAAPHSFTALATSGPRPAGASGGW